MQRGVQVDYYADGLPSRLVGRVYSLRLPALLGFILLTVLRVWKYRTGDGLAREVCRAIHIFILCGKDVRPVHYIYKPIHMGWLFFCLSCVDVAFVLGAICVVCC